MQVVFELGTIAFGDEVLAKIHYQQLAGSVEFCKDPMTIGGLAWQWRKAIYNSLRLLGEFTF